MKQNILIFAFAIAGISAGNLCHAGGFSTATTILHHSAQAAHKGYTYLTDPTYTPHCLKACYAYAAYVGIRKAWAPRTYGPNWYVAAPMFFWWHHLKYRRPLQELKQGQEEIKKQIADVHNSVRELHDKVDNVGNGVTRIEQAIGTSTSENQPSAPQATVIGLLKSAAEHLKAAAASAFPRNP